MSDAIPMFGDVAARVIESAPLSIHGDVYYEVVVSLDEDEAGGERAVRLRLPGHLCQRQPEPADVLELHFLMQQVDGVRFITPPKDRS